MLLLLLLLVSWTLAYISSVYANAESRPMGAVHMDQETFVAKWLDVHIGDPTDGYTLDQLCHGRGVKWIPNLVLNVDDANGGVGNVRGNVLDFVFYAISHGASILVPSFARRSPSDLSALFDGRTPFDDFFDKQHFLSTLRSACPEMRIYEEGEKDAMAVVGDRMIPRTMRADLDESNTIQASVDTMLEWLETHNVTVPMERPSLVNVGRTLWDGPDTASFHPKMRRDFGGLVRISPEIRRLAAVATFNLGRRFQLNLMPSSSQHDNGYFGAHLRTEKDAAKAGWLGELPHANFSAQTDTYLAQAKMAGSSVLYVASGSPEDLQSFAEKAWKTRGMNLTHKRELLFGVDQQKLDSLSWDQQALVDYEILLRSSQFGGFVKSSFSYNIAIARAAVLEMEGRVTEKRWWEVDPRQLDREDEMAHKDRASIVWGRDEFHEMKIPRGAWP